MSGNPLFQANPFLSQWLSAANIAAQSWRGFWSAEFTRQQTAMMNEWNRQAAQFWTSAWTAPQRAAAPQAAAAPVPAPAAFEAPQPAALDAAVPEAAVTPEVAVKPEATVKPEDDAKPAAKPRKGAMQLRAATQARKAKAPLSRNTKRERFTRH